ncbi:MAG: glucuronate isomerase [Bacteroidota bacterium]|jgi:glucuronate isomerase|nr:glucuronate isomerase [Prolixibacteraceae bacterium]MDI9562573.1 glucuronate isomerase [Bacteroidota bacterium]NLT00200.1 glucuronate isomerase [Bacteroidales bacterium]OQB80518.1 MAG: Uronate isomerase [Bacteroidetes bacterium ADurb.Bin123]HNZ69304.1 glucuronate isomerase [Prolixibacteraceae bacterium]
MGSFIHDNFLLQTKTAQELFHRHAARMAIFDYHCHIPPQDIAIDRHFANLTQIWLYGDHYKWRAMRTNGVDEKYCTGNASDWEKFEKWAMTVPFTLRNPLYHWTHLELKRFFGIDKLLSPATAREIWETCNAKLNTPEYSVRNIIRMANVHTICTTDDPVDSLEHHRTIKASGFEVRVLPAWRPDKAMMVENSVTYNQYVDQLAAVSGIEIATFPQLMEALEKRHQFFHENGCRLSDHGLETAYAEDFTEKEIEAIFVKIRNGKTLNAEEILKFKSCMLYEFGIMDHRRGWTQQFHLGALRNNNTRLFRTLGPDTGFDSIGDFEIARPLSRLLDRLDTKNRLAKTILYNLNPRDNELIGTMIGNFQDGSVPGKIQFGSGWWFLDQKDGMEKQIQALSNLGLISRFVGMLTDSRSFLSYTRHEYFRRILCNILGNDVEKGEIPADMELLGQMVENISFNNAYNYFGF